MSDVAHLKSLLGVHPDFPKKVRGLHLFLLSFPSLAHSTACQQKKKKHTQGITFLDIFPILRDPIAFESLITHFISHIFNTHKVKPDVIVGLDARGFLLGPVIAMRLGAAFVPVRKSGKLPGSVEVVKYEKEYGVDQFEMQAGAVAPGQKVVVIEYATFHPLEIDIMLSTQELTKYFLSVT